MQSTDVPPSTLPKPGAEELFAALAEISECNRLEDMLDLACEHIVAMGDFKACVLGFYTREESGYGVGGELPPDTRDRFYKAFLSSTPEGRAQRRAALWAHRRPGTNIVYLPEGEGPPLSSSAVAAPTGPGTWCPNDRLMMLYRGHNNEFDDRDDLFAMLSLDAPTSGDRPDDEVFGRLAMVDQFLGVVALHIENRLLAERLKSSSRTYQEMFDAMPAAVVVVNSAGRILYANDAGDPEHRPPLGAVGDEIRSLGWPVDVLAAIDSLIRHGAPIHTMEATLRADDRAWHTVVSGAPLTPRTTALGCTGPQEMRFVVVAKDMTECRAVQIRLQEAQKMEAVGRLAGGVAHEFNNILTGVLGNLELARDVLGDPIDPDAVALLADAQGAAERGANLTRQVLAFAHPTQTGFRSLFLTRIVQECINLLQCTADRRIEITVHSDPDLPTVFGDFGLLRQAVMNVLVNATDALAMKLQGRDPAGGWVPSLEVHIGYEPQGCADNSIPSLAMAVKDNGCGMDETTRIRAFEPFFSGPGQGVRVGLGLAMTYGVVKQHGGTVHVDSELGTGSTITIWLPAEKSPTLETPLPGADEVAHEGRILVVI